MSTPVWQPGHLYSPGTLVVPRTAPAAGAILPLTNPGFETGDLTGWTVLAGNFVVTDQEQGAFEGQYELTTRHEPEDIIVCDDRAPIRPGDSCTARIYLKPTRSSDRGTVRIYWYDEAGDPLASRPFDENPHNTPGHVQGTGGWRQSTLTKNAPAGAAFFAVGLYIRKHTGSYFGADLASWHYPVHQPQQGLMYKAVQAEAGYSDTTEPAWPGVLGQTIVDNEVTWEAVSISRVVWEAVPTMLSGTGEPDWPTTAGAFVSDGTISWEAVSRRVEDPNCPSSRVTAIVASKVFKADRDIVRFSATANPLDWTTERDAGYLPTGLQQANANDMAVLNQYRGNLVAFNASSFQMWQVDPDPQAMAILDQMDGIGSSWQHGAQPVGNELFYLSQQGVRTVGIANAAHNLAAGDVGQPIDELVQEHIEAGIKALSTYYPGAGQFWLAFTEDTPTAELRITGDLPNGRVGDPVDYTYLTTGGMRPYRFRVVSGQLPTGTTMDPATSRVTGEFTVPGFYSWRVQVEDRMGDVAWIDDTANVAEGPSINGSAPDGRIGTVYSPFSYIVTPGGAPIISVAVVKGEIPPGLSLDNGVLSGGPPSEVGSYTFTVRATDANGLYAEVEDTIVIRYASYVRWRRQTATEPNLVVATDGRWAVTNSTTLAQAEVRSDTWLPDGSYYWEGTAGAGRHVSHVWSMQGLLSRENGVITQVGRLISHGEPLGGAPGYATGALLDESPKTIISPYPNLSEDPDAVPYRIRNRASKQSGGWTWEIAIEDAPWVTLATDIPGEIGFLGISRGNVGSTPYPAIRTATIYSEPDAFKYEVPSGFTPAAAAAVPYTAADAPQLAETYTHTGNSNPQVVPLPSTVNEGDLLVVHLTYHLNASDGGLSPPSGWSELADLVMTGARRVRVLAKIAVGDEGGADLSVPTSTRVGPYIAVVRRYEAGTFTGLPSISFVNSASVAPVYEVAPSLTPLWGQDPAIYVTTFSGFSPQTFGPMPYPDNQQTETNGDLCVADCQTFAEVVGTEVPSLFELSSPDVTVWAHTLMGIEPGAPQ